MKLDDLFVDVGPASFAVRRAMEDTVATAGVGGRIAATLAQGLLDECERQLKAGNATPEELNRGMRTAIAVVLDSLSAQSQTIEDPAELARIAAAREEVDPPLAEELAKALRRVPAQSVKIVASPSRKTKVRFSSSDDPQGGKQATIVVGGEDAEQRAGAVKRAVQVAHAIAREGAVLGNGVAYLRAATALERLSLQGAESAGVESVRKVLGLPAFIKISGDEHPAELLRRFRLATDDDRGFRVTPRNLGNVLLAGTLDPTLLVRSVVKNAGDAVSTVILGRGQGAQVGSTPPEGPPPGGPPPEEPKHAAGDTPPNPKPSSAARVVRYTKVVCPRRVSLRADPFTVLVGLTIAPPSDASEPVEVDPGAPVGVHVTTSFGLDVVGTDAAELTVLTDKDGEPATFRIRASETGSHTLRVLYSQLGHAVAEVALTVEVVDQEVLAEAETSSTPMLAPGSAEPPDFRLYIAYSDFTLTFELERRNGERTGYPPVKVQGDLEQFMRVEYDRLGQLRTSRVDPVALEARGKVRKLSAKNADERIVNLGYVIWSELVPQGLRALYERERDNWRNKTLQILSDEPFVPWELVIPFDVERGLWDDEAPLCETLMLTRWLRPEPDMTAIPGAPPTELSLTSMSIVAPKPPSNLPLPGAAQEATFLAGFRAVHRVADAGVAQPTKDNVMRVLHGGTYDWFHAATHGSVQSTPTGYSPLWLDDNSSIVPNDLISPKVIKALVEHRPAFVLNACELGRGSWSLRGTAGWAKRLVGKGAGLLIAPLWNVTDELAAAFVTKLYGELANGVPLGRAVREARRTTRKTGDPTWLAYSVYGHPNATLRIGVPHA